jgi:aminoglycoside phosphotransferase (APT) family kinase protein
VILPGPVQALLEAAFPETPIRHPAPTFGGFSNLTIALSLGDKPFVLKAATVSQKRADLRREAMILTTLAGHGLPVASLHRLLESEAWTVELLPLLPGENAIRRLTDPPETLLPLFAQLGELLARVHTLPLPAPIDRDLLLPERMGMVSQAMPGLGLPADLQGVLQESLGQAVSMSQERCLVHGDPGAHNLLWDGQLRALLDWEWAGWGDPSTDIAWVLWTTHFRGLPDTVREVFLDAYGKDTLTADQLRALQLAQIAQILVRVADQPPMRDEWLRRLRWTMTR